MCVGIFDLSGVMPGWGCHACRIYNGLQREECKACGMKRCEIEVPADLKRCPSCGFGYRDSDEQFFTRAGNGGPFCPCCRWNMAEQPEVA